MANDERIVSFAIHDLNPAIGDRRSHFFRQLPVEIPIFAPMPEARPDPDFSQIKAPRLSVNPGVVKDPVRMANPSPMVTLPRAVKDTGIAESSAVTGRNCPQELTPQPLRRSDRDDRFSQAKQPPNDFGSMTVHAQ